MSKLSREDTLKLASLSRLRLTDEEIDQLGGEISAVLQYVEQLQQVDLEGLEPTTQVSGLKDVTRLDEVVDYGMSQQDLLKNAPATTDGNFVVPRMLG